MINSKRILDLMISSITLILLWPLIVLLIIIQTFDTKRIGIFYQKRVGKYGKEFNIYKIRTMRANTSITTNVTTSKDIRITKIGSILRKYKIDELPQFINVLIGNMSVVGPRPDVSDFINNLSEKDKIILSVKPGITGPGSLILINEEELLSKQEDPEEYNLKVIWPKKVAINRTYIENWTILTDIKIIITTAIVILRRLLLK